MAGGGSLCRVRYGYHCFLGGHALSSRAGTAHRGHCEHYDSVIRLVLQFKSAEGCRWEGTGTLRQRVQPACIQSARCQLMPLSGGKRQLQDSANRTIASAINSPGSCVMTPEELDKRMNGGNDRPFNSLKSRQANGQHASFLKHQCEEKGGPLRLPFGTYGQGALALQPACARAVDSNARAANCGILLSACPTASH